MFIFHLQGPNKERLGIMVASHNEDTVRYAIQLMKEHDIKPEDKVVCFGQLLGMCDHITFPLGNRPLPCHFKFMNDMFIYVPL